MNSSFDAKTGVATGGALVVPALSSGLVPGRARSAAALAALVAVLAGCNPSVPDSGAGVGFGDYSSHDLRAAQRAAGTAAREGTGPLVSGPVISGEAVGPQGTPAGGQVISTAELAQAGIPVAQGQPAPAPAPGAQAQPAPAGSGQVRISDEQDFDAVSSRESIASDQQRLDRNRAAYQQVAAEALPARSGQSNTRVIDFALATSNPVGQKQYDRPARQNMDKFYRACARYPSQDVAQDDFLKSGGPQRDSKGVDPDGDGFACYWDPTPFRLARQGAVGAPVAREVLPGEAAAGSIVGSGGVMVRTSEFDQTPLDGRR